MTIKGLTDRGLAFPELGQIRKGSPKQKIIKDGREIEIQGKDLEFFRFDLDEREVEAIATIKRIYGEKPTDINIVLPFNGIDQCWDAFLEAYTAGRLVARSDGEKFIYLVDTKTGDVLVNNGIEIASGKEKPYTAGMEVGRDYKDKPIKCKTVGRLRVVIPELQRLAYMTVLTSSLHDIANISSQLQAIQVFCIGMGKGLGGTPLVLRRRPHEISCPDTKNPGKRVRRTKFLLSIEADPQFVKAALLETKRLALPGNGLSLPEPTPITGPEWEGLEYQEEGEEEDDLVVEGTEVASPIPVISAVAPVEIIDKGTRPWSALSVKQRIQELIVEYEKNPISVTEKDRQLIASTLETTLGGDKTMRYGMTRWLLNSLSGSTKVMTPAQVKAIMAWQGVNAFGDVPIPEVIAETKAVYMASLEAEGQKRLFPEQ